MARQKTAAMQAIRDMLECKIDVSFLIGNIRKYRNLNIEIGIETETPQPKKSVEIQVSVAVNYMPPEVHKTYVPRYFRTINPDGTVSIGRNTDWDRD